MENSSTVRYKAEPLSEETYLPFSKLLELEGQLQAMMSASKTEKAIVFVQHYGPLEVLKSVCQKNNWEFATIDGRTQNEARDEQHERFSNDANDANVRILISTLKVTGCGHNITVASRVFCLDLWWNEALEAQGFGRVHRIGQRRRTIFMRFIAANTTDVKTRALQIAKQTMINKLFNDDRRRVTDAGVTANGIMAGRG